MNTGKLTVSVIICGYTMNRLQDIREAVDSIFTQTLKPDEIIISIDHNEELIRKLKEELPSEVRVVLNEGHRGISETRNVGIRASTSDITAFIDDDAVADEDWLQNIMRHYDDPLVMAVGGKLISVWKDGRPGWFPEELDWIVGGTYKGHPVVETPIRNLIAANMSFRTEVPYRIGFFLTSLGALGRKARAGDETEFCMRITHQIPDGIVLYDPEASAQHKALPHQTTLKNLVARSFNEGLYKGKASGIYSTLSRKPLSVESAYLRHLILTSIPWRLVYFYKKGSLPQLGAIALSTAVTGLGYLTGRVTGNDE